MKLISKLNLLFPIAFLFLLVMTSGQVFGQSNQPNATANEEEKPRIVRTLIQIDGITDAEVMSDLKRILNQVDGITSFELNEGGPSVITYYENKTDANKLLSILTDAGYEAQIKSRTPRKGEKMKIEKLNPDAR